MAEDKQRITIRIPDNPEIPLSINRDDEEFFRKAEKGISDLWSKWSEVYKNKTSKEVYALVAIQFARLYYQALNQADKREAEKQSHEILTKKVLDDFEKELDNILLKL
ncbi:MAG: cell division protein ZapA [Bacteroidales bacterium]